MLPSVQPFSDNGGSSSSATNPQHLLSSGSETNTIPLVAEWVVNPDHIVSAIYSATERQAAFPRDIINLVTEYLQNHEALKSLSMFGSADWTTTFHKKVEMIQPTAEMDAFLQKINPFTGKLNAESCICVFIPSYYQDIPHNTKEEQELLNNPPIPLTPSTMGELAKNSSNSENKTKFKFFLDFYNKDSTEKELKEARKGLLNLHVKKSYWIVITSNVIPGSRDQVYSKQKELIHEKGAKEYWQIPSIREAIICAFAYYAKTGVGIPRWTYTRCVEQIHDYQTVIVGFAPSGLDVRQCYYNLISHGVVALRKFAF